MRLENAVSADPVDATLRRILADALEEAGLDERAGRERMTAAMLEGMPQAVAIWRRLRMEHGLCCGGPCISPHLGDPLLSFHGKHWHDNYYEDEDEPVVGVDCGVVLKPESIRTYWVFDNDISVESVEYGEAFLYPPEGSEEELIARILLQLDHAAEAAFFDGVTTCEVCGYHQYDVAPHDHGDDDCEEARERLVALARDRNMTARDVASLFGVDGDRLNNGGLVEVFDLLLAEGDDEEWLIQTLEEYGS